MKRTTGLRPFGFVALVCFLFTSSRAHADTLYLSCQGNGYESNSGKIMQLDTTSGSVSTFASGLSVPWGLALDSSGSLYAAMNHSGGAINKFDASGNPSLYNSLGGNSQPWYLAFDGSGNLYVSGYLYGAPIMKIDPSGNVSAVSTNLYNPRDIVFDKSDNLYARDNSGTTYRIDASGNKSVFVTGTTEGLAFDNSGNLFMVNWNNGNIEKVDPSGHVSVFANSGFSSPTGLTFDSAGNLYVMNWGSTPYTGTIKKFDPNGNSTTVATGLDYPAAFAVLPVPEPATWALLVLGAFALLGGPRSGRGGSSNSRGLTKRRRSE